MKVKSLFFGLALCAIGTCLGACASHPEPSPIADAIRAQTEAIRAASANCNKPGCDHRGHSAPVGNVPVAHMPAGTGRQVSWDLTTSIGSGNPDPTKVADGKCAQVNGFIRDTGVNNNLPPLNPPSYNIPATCGTTGGPITTGCCPGHMQMSIPVVAAPPAAPVQAPAAAPSSNGLTPDQEARARSEGVCMSCPDQIALWLARQPK